MTWLKSANFIAPQDTRIQYLQDIYIVEREKTHIEVTGHM